MLNVKLRNLEIIKGKLVILANKDPRVINEEVYVQLVK